MTPDTREELKKMVEVAAELKKIPVDKTWVLISPHGKVYGAQARDLLSILAKEVFSDTSI